MDLTEYTIRHKTVSWMIVLLLVLGGVISFMGIGRLEDPEFTIKQAVITTAYPGASSQEVEEEITLPIENALQQLPYVDNITSISSAGLSQVTVEMKKIYRKKALAQIWDEMRRKINDMSASLPPGSHPPVINDDFSDVFGIFLAISGPGYEMSEIEDYAEYLRRELVLVDGVGKVAIGGARTQQVVLETSRSKMASFNFPFSTLKSFLASQNMVSDAGRIQVGSEYVRVSSTGTYDKVEDLGDMMLGQADGKVIYLRDVASIRRDVEDPPQQTYRFNGQPALTLGVSFSSGVNVVEVGQAVSKRLAELEYTRPIGMETGTIYNQPEQVHQAVNNFLVSLVEAVAIVIVVLLVAMGWHSGLLMSIVLLLTILATFIVMKVAGIPLHRISLGALIVALGMLVDNAIVITEGILIGMKRGLHSIDAAKRIIKQTQWPLLGATIIAVTAFAPIGLSPDASGEFAGTLFWVLLISLMISWIMAITITPFFANMMFHQEDTGTTTAETTDPYRGAIYQVYKDILLLTLRFRWATVAAMLMAMAVAIYGFRFVNHAFFPPSNLPMFVVDYWLPEGSDIRITTKDMAALEPEILKNPDVTQVTTVVGRGAMRFMLTYAGERNYPSYGQFLIQVKNIDALPKVRAFVDTLIREHNPQAFSKSERMRIGPANKGKVEARISGPDSAVLRELANRVIRIFRNDPDAVDVRHDWRERTKILRPQFQEAEARRLGLSKAELDSAISMNLKGVQIGVLRDGATLLPIILQPPENERSDIDKIGDIQVFSPALGRYVDIGQVTHGIRLEWEDPLIMRRNRKRTILVWANEDPQGTTNSFALFDRLRPLAEKTTLPPGYSLEWGGEFESQKWAYAAVFRFVPLGLIVMLAVTILLFNSIRQTLVVWLTLPLSIIGVTFGLLLFGQPFAFTALLGFLSLSGMIIKNGIVLVEEIKRLNEEEAMGMHDAITQAAVSRMRPVMMAAITTVLGLIPLLWDVFFAPLAVTIMFGLGFATILTLIMVPVLFALLYGVHYRKGEARNPILLTAIREQHRRLRARISKTR